MTLTPLEYKIIQQLTTGATTNKAIAKALGISERTVKNKMYAIARERGLKNRTHVAMWAIKEKIVPYKIIPPALNAIINRKIDLEASINWMADNGSSVILNWGDDNELWEVAWIFDGKRYCGFSRSPREAVIQAVVVLAGSWPSW